MYSYTHEQHSAKFFSSVGREEGKDRVFPWVDEAQRIKRLEDERSVPYAPVLRVDKHCSILKDDSQRRTKWIFFKPQLHSSTSSSHVNIVNPTTIS
jgi:hypothetical protein